MAPITPSSANAPIATLPRLLAINKDAAGLDEQIRQATHIIRLPSHWETIQHKEERSEATETIAKARAEWVLRWILDKLKDTDAMGAQARANPKAWKLVEWMLWILAPSRSAMQLRDAGFLTILEKALEENFEKDFVAPPSAPDIEPAHKDASESSETVQEDPRPSRKRKRTSGASTPSKRVAVDALGLEQLFLAIAAVVKAMIGRSGSADTNGNSISSEHMKVSLRTESAQAARISKFWLMAVQKVLTVSHTSSTPVLDTIDDSLSLSLMLDIWEHRSVEAEDESGASAEQFSAECLIPSLLLYDLIHGESPSIDSGRIAAAAKTNATRILERLLVRHLFVPARTAFLAAVSSRPSKDMSSNSTATEALGSNLRPLRAKIEQASEIHDATVVIPEAFLPMFRAIPRLLDMAIRFSPTRSPKSRISERPWVEVVFVALAECAGCPLKAPEYPVPRLSIDTLEKALGVLKEHSFTVSSSILEDLFWFHSGFNFPEKQRKIAHWHLIAALISLDPDVFLPKRGIKASDPSDRPEDLSSFLFERIPTWSAQRDLCPRTPEKEVHDYGVPQTKSQSEPLIDTIIGPLVSAFARNRDLLGFISRWDSQLCRDPTEGHSEKASLWLDDKLSLALIPLFENSLTRAQILGLFERHQARINRLRKNLKSKSSKDPQKLSESFRNAVSSSVILHALLRSLSSDELVEALKPQLSALVSTFASLVSNDDYRAGADMGRAWTLIGQLWAMLWPIEIHRSMDLQRQYFDSVVAQACRDLRQLNEDTTPHHPHTPPAGEAALAFILAACDHLRTVPGWTKNLSEATVLAYDSLSAKTLQPKEMAVVLDLLCSRYTHLLKQVNPEARIRVFQYLFCNVSGSYDSATRKRVAASMSQSFLDIAGSDAVELFTTEVAAALSKTMEDGWMDFRQGQAADGLLAELSPYALSRAQREVLLDRMTDALLARGTDSSSILSNMVHLMELPNSTAKISRKATTLFDMSQSLHENKLESAATLKIFKTLVELTLDRILENRDQPQNVKYLQKFASKVASATKKANKCHRARLALLGSVFAVQKAPAMLPLEQYLKLLGNCLNESSDSAENILDALNEIPTRILRDNEGALASAQATLRKWMDPSFSLESFSEDQSAGHSQDLSSPIWLCLHRTVQRFQLYPDLNAFLKLSQTLLRGDLSAQEQNTILESVKDCVSTLAASEKLGLINNLTSEIQAQSHTSSFRILNIIIAGVDDAGIEDPAERQQQLSILPTLCQHLSRASDTVVFNSILDSIDSILRDKLFLVTQHNFESVLTAIVGLCSRTSPAFPAEYAQSIYTRLCETTRLMLLLHRSRLGGRYHLLVQSLQNLLFCLFLPNAGRGTALPAWLQPTPAKLSPANASQYARLLSTLCSPTTSSVSKHAVGRSHNSLNDPVKAAKKYASHHLYPLLAAFCRFQLNGRLEPAVKEKLMPGIWDAMAVANMDREALDGMNAGLDSATRAVWKGLWGEWRRGPGKRDGE